MTPKDNYRKNIASISFLMKKPSLESQELEVLFDKSHSPIFRVFWLLMMVCSLFVCIYQISDRIKYYLKYPIAVDIFANELSSPGLLQLTLCSLENDFLLTNFKNMTRIIQPLACMFPMAFALHEVENRNNFSFDNMWEYESVTNTIHSVNIKTRVGNDITFSVENTVFGQCTTLMLSNLTRKDLMSRVKIRVKTGIVCEKTYTLGFLNAKSSRRLGFFVEAGAELNMQISIRRYNYINTPRTKCVTQDEFDTCFQLCVSNTMMSKCKCRILIYPEAVKLPECIGLDNATKSYQMALQILAEPDLFDSCGCIKTCDLISHSVQIETFNWFPNESILTLGVDDVVLLLNERRAYDEISLLTDVGGNLGLLLGFNVLSLLNIFNILSIYLNKYIYSNQNVLKKYKLCTSRLIRRQKSVEFKQINSQKVINWILMINCACLALFMIYNRISKYFEYSVSNTVEVEAKSRIIFPSFTICGINSKFQFFLKKYVNAHNVTNWCNVEFLDLFQSNKNFEDIDYLWKATYWPYSSIADEEISKVMKFELIKANTTDIHTHMGQCVHYKFREQTFTGVLMIYMALHLHPGARACNYTVVHVFFDDPESDSYDIFKKLEVPIELASIIDFEVKRVVKLNRRFHPCIEQKSLIKCVDDCLTNLIKASNMCRLPFLDKYANLTNCKTRFEMKESRQTFYNLVNLARRKNICNCGQPCVEKIITFSPEYKVTTTPDKFKIYLKIHNNIEETVKEVEKYPIIPLCCDIGNCLGISMGMSYLIIVKNIFNAFAFFKNRPKK